MARIVDAAFVHGLGVGVDYRIEAHFEPSGLAAPGPLDTPLSRLSPAGWGLLVLSCAVIVLVATVLGPWALGVLGAPGLRESLWMVLVLGIPGLVAGGLVYQAGRRFLARRGISTQRSPE